MACPFVAYSSKDKRGKRPSMHRAPPSKKAGLSVRCGCHGECRSCWTCQLCIAPSLQTSSPSSAVLQGCNIRRRVGKEIPVTYCWQGWLVAREGKVSSVPSSDNSDQSTTLAASSLRRAPRMETCQEPLFPPPASVLSAPNNPFDPLSTLA